MLNRKGFTLVELLIVIGILGVLAAGLLAILDPVDQIMRGRDTQRRRLATEVTSALTRYYAISQKMPWGTAGVTQERLRLSAATGTVLASLISSGELKSSFNTGAANYLSDLYVMGDASANAWTCFNPESKAISLDPTVVYASLAASITAPSSTAICPDAASACFFCSQ